MLSCRRTWLIALPQTVRRFDPVKALLRYQDAVLVTPLVLVVVTFASTHITLIQGRLPMRLSSAIRAVLIALTVTGGFGTAPYAHAGRIRFNVLKAGFFFCGSARSGPLLFYSPRYPFSIRGGGGHASFFSSPRPPFLAA